MWIIYKLVIWPQQLRPLQVKVNLGIMDSLLSLDLKNWNLTIRHWFSVISRTSLFGSFTLCRVYSQHILSPTDRVVWFQVTNDNNSNEGVLYTSSPTKASEQEPTV